MVGRVNYFLTRPKLMVRGAFRKDRDMALMRYQIVEAVAAAAAAAAQAAAVAGSMRTVVAAERFEDAAGRVAVDY